MLGMNETTQPTCKTCIHFDRCKWLLQRDGDEAKCDWVPSRYVPRQTTSEDTQP